RHPLRSGFTAYAALSPATNSSCYRRRRTLATLRPGRVKPVTADLAPATGVRTTRFCRTLETSFVVARLLEPLTGPLRTRPATAMRADALASTTSRPAFVTIAIRPSCRNGTGDLKPLIWGRCEAQSCPSCHCAAALSLVIPGREAKRSEPGIHNHQCLLLTTQRPQLRATSTIVVMDSGLAPSGRAPE